MSNPKYAPEEPICAIATALAVHVIFVLQAAHQAAANPGNFGGIEG